MKKITLSEYLAGEGTQKQLADALGIQQTAVSQMARSGRTIEVTIYANGRIDSFGYFAAKHLARSKHE